MKTIAFINEKGGVGKTTLCFNIAWELAENSKVLLVDLDGQIGNMTFMCGKEDILPTISDVLDGQAEISSAILQVRPNLFLLPADCRIADMGGYDDPFILKNELDKISDSFDYTMIDVSPSPNSAHAFELISADCCICPVLPDVFAIPSMYAIARSVEEIQRKFNPRLKYLGVVINQQSLKTNLSRQACEEIDAAAFKLGTYAFHTKIRDTVRVKESANEHMGITGYVPKASISNSIRRLTKEIEEKIGKNG